jgi:hypothetical protein
MQDLPLVIEDLFKHYVPDVRAIESYVAASMAVSARVNLYSGLLHREGVYVPHAVATGDTDLDRLAALAMRHLENPTLPPERACHSSARNA